MPKPQDDPARHKAVLAAVLAVQRGFLSPEEAVRVLAELRPGAPEAPMDTLLSVAPTSARSQIEADVEALGARAEDLPATLSDMGLTPDAQSSLLALKPDTSSEAATRALASIADRQQRVKDMTSRLPGASTSGRYVLRREFARGGMGLIYVAMDTAVGREVALKELLPPGMDDKGTTAAPELIERFLREAKVTGQLEHPNIVPVYEIATREDGGVFYTMKLVHGRTMARRLLEIQNGPGTEASRLAERLKLLDAFNDVCNAIAYAHSRGVIHRDIKPANIMLGDFGETLVLDWGLARVRGQEESSDARRKANQKAFSPSLLEDGSTNRTLDGSVLGTPAYMPPEQARGELDKVDERADVYALGAILYEILSGRPPYAGGNARDILARVLVLEPESLRKAAPHAPPDLVSLAEKAMAREPDKRLESAAILGREVMAFRDGRNLSVYRYSSSELIGRFVRRHRAAVGVACVAVAMILAGAVYAFVNIRSERDQARVAFAQAEQERLAREETERRQHAERRRLVAQREGEITRQRSRVRDQRGENLAAEARRRVGELEARGTLTGGLPPSDRAENSRIVSDLLADAAARAELIRLLSAPVAGHIHEFVAAADLAAEQETLDRHRYLAAELAMLNEDFALADFIVDGTGTPGASRAEWKRRVEGARTALQTRHREAIILALDDVRAGLARVGRPSGGARLEDYVMQLSAYREGQTVELLGTALRPFIEKAAVEGHDTLWTQPERDEVTLICRVLGYLELPEQTVPLLAEFMAEVKDYRLAIECGNALCLTAHHAAYDPLMAVRERFGRRSYVWGQVSRRFDRVPEPGRAEPTTVAEFLRRGMLRYDQRRTVPAGEDARAALTIEPDNIEALLLLAACLGAKEESFTCLERVLELDPDNGTAWLVRAGHLRALGRYEAALEAALKSVKLVPDDPRGYLLAGFIRGFIGGMEETAIEEYTEAIRLDPYMYAAYANRAAVYIETGRYQLALGDATRSIELNPYHPEAYNNRAIARKNLGDHQGAIEDLTRMLEIVPAHSWAYINRAASRMELGQYLGAVDDLDHVIARNRSHLPHALRMRGEARRALDDPVGALEDFREYLKAVPEAADREKVEAWIRELEGNG
jgi:serine/threonine protein kinase/regulator of sirC expression with transglutaminase-like and TPR domain